MTRVSIGLPVYNGERFLRSAVDSVLAQTFQDFELIVCDNASSDASEAICREYAARDARVRYIRHPENIGAARNFRRVFELAHGELFRWIGVDDYWAPELLARCVQALDAHPRAVAACTKVNIVDGEGKILRRYEDEQDLRDESAVARFRRRLNQDSWCNAVYSLMRAEVMRATPLMGNFSGSDVVFMGEMSLYGWIVEVPEYLFFRRIHAEAYSYECDVNKVREFYAPKQRSTAGFVLRAWRHLLEFARAARKAPLTWRERAQVLAHVLRMAWWDKGKLAAELGAAARALFARG